MQGYRAAGQLERVRETLRWGADYLMVCHTGRNRFVGQVRWRKGGKGEVMVERDLERGLLVRPQQSCEWGPSRTKYMWVSWVLLQALINERRRRKTDHSLTA